MIIETLIMNTKHIIIFVTFIRFLTKSIFISHFIRTIFQSTEKIIMKVILSKWYPIAVSNIDK